MKNKNLFLVKFAIVSAMIGLFSPSVNVKTNVQSGNSYSAVPIQLNISLFKTAEARRGGGGGGARRSSSNRSRSSNRNTNKNVNRNTNKNVNRNVNKNVNKNVNVNRNVNKNVNVNVNRNSRYYGGRHYGYYRGRPLVPFAAGLAIGTMVAVSTMPSSCTTVIANGISYRRCSNAYYQPFYEGDTMVYRVVASPY